MSILKVSSSSSSGGVLSKSDKILSPNATIFDGALTGIAISNTPSTGGYVGVFVNGLMVRTSEDETRDCYFSGTITDLTPIIDAVLSDIQIALLTNTGTCYICGTGNSGALGDGTTTARQLFKTVQGNHSFVQLARGSFQHFLARKSDGTVWSWGSNTNGDNTNQTRSSPVSVVGAHSFVSINAISSNGGQGIKSDGTIWTWGNAANGQLGDGANAARSSPVSVIGAHSFVKLGQRQSYIGSGIKSDGSAWMWGQNSGNGAVGDGTATNRSSPVSVLGAHSFVDIGCGQAQTIALKENGTVWCWGSNSIGQLGDGTVTSRSSPVSVIGEHSFVAIAPIYNGWLALKSDGSAWSCGEGTNGILGEGVTAVNRSSPVSVIGNHSFTSVLPGQSGSIAMKQDGSVWTWGLNQTSSHLGDQTIINRSSPVSVFAKTFSPRVIGEIVAGDQLVWNGSIAGAQLATTSRIDLMYVYSP